MKIFLDTADINEIKSLCKTGLIDGVTTNPSLILKSGKDFLDTIDKICKIIDGPVSAEVTQVDFDKMLKEAKILSSISEKVAVKVPLTEQGLNVCYELSKKNIMVNVTLCFSSSQAILAAKAGAKFISPFWGRLDDISQNGQILISEIIQIYKNYNFKTEVLVASIRNPQQVVESAKLGSDIVTIPTKVFNQLYKHPLTDSGLEIFINDFKKTKQSIL